MNQRDQRKTIPLAQTLLNNSETFPKDPVVQQLMKSSKFDLIFVIFVQKVKSYRSFSVSCQVKMCTGCSLCPSS